MRDRAASILLRVAVAVAAIVLATDAAAFFGVEFASNLHSDAANTILLAVESVRTRSIVAPSWYWANGDLWVLAPHLYAIPLVAWWGAGPKQLLVTVIVGFAVDVAALAWSYRRLGASPLAAALATAVTLVAWSHMHVLYVYVELAYGFITTTYVVLFALFAVLTARVARVGEERGRDARVVGAASAAFMFLLAVGNPTRGLVFGVAPLAVAFAWPWRGIRLGARVTGALAAAAGWVAARVVYHDVLLPRITRSSPTGLVDLVVESPAQIAANLKMIAGGLFEACGATGRADALAVPTAIVLTLAFARVAAEVVSSRALTKIRFVCVAALVQLAGVAAPLVAGNLMVTPLSVRYLMPSLLTLLGLAALLAAGDLRGEGPRARVSAAWVALVPIAAIASLTRVLGGCASDDATGRCARRPPHAVLAAELSRRGLAHGFASYWNANVVTLFSDGRTHACGVIFGAHLVPYRWNTSLDCFDRRALPDRFYVVERTEERAWSRPALAAMPPPIERFRVGDDFDVSVFATTDATIDWLEVPLPEGDALKMPLHLRATHPQIARGEVVAEGGALVATGKDGALVSGPYLVLPKGRYRAVWIGSGVEDATGELVFDATVDRAKIELAHRTVEAAEIAAVHDGLLVSLDFELASTVRGVELRVFARGGARVKLDELVLDRAP